MKAIITFLILTMSLHSVAQDKMTTDRTDTLEKIQDMIRKDGLVSTRFVGFAGAPSSQWHRVAYLMSMATPEELQDMTNDSSPALQLAAYAGMLQCKHPGTSEVRKRLLRDNDIVSTIAGCIVSDIAVQDIVKQINSWYDPLALEQEIQRLQSDPAYRMEQFERIRKNDMSDTAKPKQAEN